MSADTAVYPMPLFVRLTVADLDESVEWYRAVGFSVVYEMLGMAHLRYRKYADVMLVGEDRVTGERRVTESAGERRRGRGVAVYLTVETESVDDVASRATASDLSMAGPHETAWNTRELTLRDPDGYELVFSEVVDPDRSFEDVMGESDAAGGET